MAETNKVRLRHGASAAAEPQLAAAPADDESKGKGGAAGAPAAAAAASGAPDALPCVPTAPKGAWAWGDKALPLLILLLCIYTRFWNIHLPSGIVFDVRLGKGAPRSAPWSARCPFLPPASTGLRLLPVSHLHAPDKNP